MTTDPRCDFAGSYALSRLPAVKALESEVLGCDYGGTSWTTVDQIPQLVSALALDAGTRLLEVGCGSGWPGLYISRITGCRVTILDMPFVAIELAAERAASDRMLERVDLVNASGTALPFAAGTFDRVSHSDVLCCLPDKFDLLRECRRVVSDAGRMHFSVIEPRPGLSPEDHRRAVDTGPPFVEVPGDYPGLLEKARWQVVERVDVSREFAESLQKLATGLKRNTPGLRDAFGADGLREAWQRRDKQRELVGAGILQRMVYVAAAA